MAMFLRLCKPNLFLQTKPLYNSMYRHTKLQYMPFSSSPAGETPPFGSLTYLCRSSNLIPLFSVHRQSRSNEMESYATVLEKIIKKTRVNIEYPSQTDITNTAVSKTGITSTVGGEIKNTCSGIFWEFYHWFDPGRGMSFGCAFAMTGGLICGLPSRAPIECN